MDRRSGPGHPGSCTRRHPLVWVAYCPLGLATYLRRLEHSEASARRSYRPSHAEESNGRPHGEEVGRLETRLAPGVVMPAVEVGDVEGDHRAEAVPHDRNGVAGLHIGGDGIEHALSDLVPLDGGLVDKAV